MLALTDYQEDAFGLSSYPDEVNGLHTELLKLFNAENECFTICQNIIEEEEAIIESDEETSTVTINEEQIARQLTEIMTQRQLYLNPKLTLKEVAAAIGTNMTYLSIYLNHRLNASFYDYVNCYRVEEACRILSRMSGGERINMTEVAQRSGFNSVSTFNRNFKKTKGITPKEYYFNRIQ